MPIVSRAKKRLYLSVARYFKFFADFSLRRWHPRIIAITGSVGKTTMLHLIESQMRDKAHYNHDANSPFGVAFDILGLHGVTGSKLRWITLFFAAPIRAFTFTHREKFYIVEIDGERPHETTFLASWLRPEVTIWVSLGRSHAVYFESDVASGRFATIDEAITHEFAELPHYTKKLIITDADIPAMKVENTSAKLLPLKKSAVTSYTVYPDKTIFETAGTTFTLPAPLPPDISIQLVMLESLLDYLELPLDPTFKHLTFPPGRGTFFHGKNGINIIDSTYNAHLISVNAIAKMTKSLRAHHKWLVIGDIVDQGTLTEEEHTKLVQVLLDATPEKIILIGRRTHKYTYPALKKSKVPTESFLDVKQALKYIDAHITGEETLIVKGSQYLEWLVEQLLKNPADAARLPRRDKAAAARRKDWGLDK